MALKPVGDCQKIAVSGSSAKSSPFSHQSEYVRLVSVGTSCHVGIGTSVTATTADFYIKTDGEATLSCGRPSSQRVVGVETGTVTFIDFPEGTGSPFATGDTVSLTVVGQSYYDFTSKVVSDVLNQSDGTGYYNTRIAIDYDSSGIVTAFNAPWAELRSTFEVGAITPGSSGNLYVQQVQVTGDA